MAKMPVVYLYKEKELIQKEIITELQFKLESVQKEKEELQRRIEQMKHSARMQKELIERLLKL